MAEWLTMRAWNMPQSLNWWVAPINRQAKIAYFLIGSFLPPGRYKANTTDLSYELLRKNGNVHSRIEFRSADNLGTIRGDGVNSVVCDEGSYWKHDSFVSVMTTLTRTRGFLRCISTPRGKNWFWQEWLKGWEKENDPERAAKYPEHISYRLPTHQNPFVPRASLLEFEANMPAQNFRQEILAEFLDDSAGVFLNITKCAKSVLQSGPTSMSHQYVIGIDWAKKQDFTVFTVMDRATRKVVAYERHNGVDWGVNIDLALRCAKRWNNATVWMDSTGLGDVPFDQMRMIYPHINGYNISGNAEKVALIQKLQLAFSRSNDENQEVWVPNDGIYKRELEMYGYEMSATGRFQFNAPDGYNDDCVISLALAYWGCAVEPFRYKARNVRGI
jgi:terminase large subunit-like protein